MIYDFVIIGAGLAGLSVAGALNSKKVLILEANDKLGGRIESAQWKNDYFVDTGAMINFNPNYPQAKGLELILETGDFGIERNGEIVTSNNIDGLLLHLPARERKEIEKWRNEKLKFKDLSEDVKIIVNSVFKSIFPSDCWNYSDHLIMSGFRRYYPSHYKAGNGQIIQSIERNLVNVEIRNNSKATEILKSEVGFAVKFQTNGNSANSDIQSKKIVLATDPLNTRELIERSKTIFLPNNYYSFLKSLRTGDLLVAYFQTRKRLIGHLSYLLTNSSDFSLIGNWEKEIDGMFTNVVLFHSPYAIEYSKYDESEFLKKIEQQLFKLTRKSIEVNYLCRRYWRNAGILINDKLLEQIESENTINPIPDLYICGDYLGKGLPYGMNAAISSAGRVIKKIENE